jgi:hypothetical protein
MLLGAKTKVRFGKQDTIVSGSIGPTFLRHRSRVRCRPSNLPTIDCHLLTTTIENLTMSTQESEDLWLFGYG